MMYDHYISIFDDIYTGEDAFNILPKTVINLDEETSIVACIINDTPIQPKLPRYCCGAYIIKMTNSQYVGSTIDLMRRIREHRSRMGARISNIDVYITSNIDEAKVLERYFICGPVLFTELRKKEKRYVQFNRDVDIRVLTTVEVSDEVLRRLKTAKYILQKNFNIKMRMSDIMDHLVKSPDDIVDAVFQSIQKKWWKMISYCYSTKINR